MAVFFRRSSCFKRRLGLLSTDGIMAGHLTPLRALPLSYVVRCSQELADKTNRSIGWFCLALPSSAIYSTVLMAVFFSAFELFQASPRLAFNRRDYGWGI